MPLLANLALSACQWASPRACAHALLRPSAQVDGGVPFSPFARLSLDLPPSPRVRCPMSDKLLNAVIKRGRSELSQTCGAGISSTGWPAADPASFTSEVVQQKEVH